MSVKPSQPIAGRFTISDPAADGALSNADSLPTGALLENGDDDEAVTVTVSNVSAGIYKWSCTVPSDYTAGTLLEIQITATLNTVAVGGVVWSDTVDTQYLKNLAGANYIEGTQALDTTPTLDAVVDAHYDEPMAGHTVAGSAGRAIGSKYWVQFDFNGGTTANAYEGVRWIKDDQPLDSGVTNPVLRVINTTTGADLIASKAMIEAGASHLFRYVAGGSELTVPDVSYKARFTATIDGATRTFEHSFRGST